MIVRICYWAKIRFWHWSISRSGLALACPVNTSLRFALRFICAGFFLFSKCITSWSKFTLSCLIKNSRCGTYSTAIIISHTWIVLLDTFISYIFANFTMNFRFACPVNTLLRFALGIIYAEFSTISIYIASWPKFMVSILTNNSWLSTKSATIIILITWFELIYTCRSIRSILKVIIVVFWYKICLYYKMC